MLSPGFIDGLLFFVLFGFAMKGYVTGFIRSVVTLVAVLIAIGASAALPTIAAPMLGYSVSPNSAQFLVVNRMASFLIFFGVAQSVGFLATGLLEKIGLGTADKFVGAVLGIATGVIVGCLPGLAIYASPVAFHNKANQRYFKSSFFMKAYQPIVKSMARAPKPPKEKRSEAGGRNVT